MLVTIDGLRYDQLGVVSGPPHRTSTLDALARAGTWCRRAYAASWYTQFSFPAILSSTLPLDHGGYDQGVSNRPVLLAETLRASGRRTAAFSTDPCLNAYYGYDRGFDEFFELFELESLWHHVTRDYLAHYTAHLADGTMTPDEVEALALPMLARLLAYSREYAAAARLGPASRLLSRLRSPLFAECPDALAARVESEYEAWSADPQGYLDLALRSAAEPRPEEPEPGPVGALEWLGARLGGQLAKRRRRMVDALEVVDLAERWVSQSDRPFFAWLSLSDVHDGNVSARWCDLDAVRFGRRAARLDGAARLAWRDQCAATFVDRALRRLCDGLRRLGRLDDTVIAICADHGRIPGAPAFSGLFSDALVRVPFIVWTQGQVPEATSHPASLLDIAPSILARLGLQPEVRFKGCAVGSPAFEARDHVLVEQLGGGPCDLARKQPYLCAISASGKYAWHPNEGQWWLDLEEQVRRGFRPVEADDGRMTRWREACERRYAEIRAHGACQPPDLASPRD